MVVAQATTTTTQASRRIIERLATILVCCGTILSGIFFAFVEAMALYSTSTGFEGTQPQEYITMLITLVYAINLIVQAPSMSLFARCVQRLRRTVSKR